MINSKEELEDGHWVGFRFEYTCGQAHGSVSAELTDQDPDPDDPGRKIYYLVIIHEEKRPWSAADRSVLESSKQGRPM